MFSQKDYEERVRNEAEMMVALEALKTSTNYLYKDTLEIKDIIKDQWDRIDGNLADAITDLEDIISTSFGINQRILQLTDKCGEGQKGIQEEEKPLVLYCQQFAYSPDMIEQCRTIVKCRNKHILFKKKFDGKLEHDDGNQSRQSQSNN